MKFASISHLIDDDSRKAIPPSFFHENIILSPEISVFGTKGFIIALNRTAHEIMCLPRGEIRNDILKAILFAQNELDIELVQLGALTTSVTHGGEWLVEQEKYQGFVNHGDSYTAAVTCQAVRKAIKRYNQESSDLVLAVVGAYGIIGEAVSKILVPMFSHSILVGRNQKRFKELEKTLEGSYNTTTTLNIKDADVVVTATSHPTALLQSFHLKKNAIVIDVSQPPNLSYKLCKTRPDIIRIDGGIIDFPMESPIPIPGMPIGKNFACFAEVIMQALENEQKNHVGSIILSYLKKTEQWGKKYGFLLNELTNFGKAISEGKEVLK